MSKIFKLILLPVIAISIFFGFSTQTLAVDSPLSTIEFETTPLFSEVNFIPGKSASRFVSVRNNDSMAHRLIARAINVHNAGQPRLSDALELAIKQGGTVLYNDTFSNFFDLPQVVLPQILGGGEAIFDFVVTFEPESGNEYQNSTMDFNFEVGFEDTDIVVNDDPLPVNPGNSGNVGHVGGGIIRTISNLLNPGQSGEVVNTNGAVESILPQVVMGSSQINVSNRPASLTASSMSDEKPALFDITSEPVESAQKSPAPFVFSIIALILLILFLVFTIRRVKKYIETKTKMKKENNIL